MTRHSAQTALQQIGEEGQRKLEAAKVLIVGVGGLGSTVAELLCRAGVRNLTLCDFDIVQESNLQRQSLYTTEDVGRPKVEAAKEHLIAIDPMCLIACISEPFSSAVELKEFTIIIDGTDSLQARLLLNDAAKRAGLPLVIGTASQTRGLVYVVGSGPCWQCVTRGKTAIDTCESGILGMTTHAVASLQATATARTILGEPPQGLVELDVWEGRSRTITVARNPACAACSGRYEHLEAPFALYFCTARERLQARPNRPRLIDLDAVKEFGPVEKAYGSALLIRLGGGTALVHRFGTIEFDGVQEEEAKRFAERVLQ